MSPRAYMLVGFFAGATMAVTQTLLPDAGLAFPLFAAGAVFGKGYGIWEERS